MGIFSFFARKAVTVFPSYVKAPSSSSGLSSRSDNSTDSDHVDLPVMFENPQVSRSCLKSYKSNMFQQDSIGLEFYTPSKDPFRATRKPNSNCVRFAPNLEQVNFVETFCNDPSLDLWSTRKDYMRRYTADLAVVRSEQTNHIEKRRLIGEREYLTACNVAYHQFCLTGSVDKSLQRTMLIGIECGYRALERFTSDHQLRRELSQRIRKSTVLLYQSLYHHRADSVLNGTQDNTDIYLRAHIESLNFHHIRWALFLGRLDRLAARNCMRTKVDKAMMQSYQTITRRRRLLEIEVKPRDDCAQSPSSNTLNDLPLYPELALNDDMSVMDVFSTSIC